jgi:membrane protein
MNGLMPNFLILMNVVNFIVSFGVIAFLFTLIFKVIPNANPPWRSVWPGGVLTAALFLFGKMLISVYLGHAAVASTYGAAGSFVALLVWVYYSAQILFFGAEFTYVYSMYLKRPKKS